VRKPKTLAEVIASVKPPPGGWESREAVLDAVREQNEANMRAEQELNHRRQLVAWGVPAKDVERITVAGLNRTRPLERIERHTEGILVLAGSVGCGKTTAAAWWLSQQEPAHKYVKTTSPVFIPTFRFERLSRYSDADMARVERARRLVVDDIGTEFLDTKGNFVALLRGLVDARYADGLPMVITTNLSADDFASRYGERTIDRLREVGAFAFIDAPSLRGAK